MRIKKIVIENLFETFKHEIKMNDSGITIIIGENGLGKTILLEVIDAFFNRRFFFLNSIAFTRLLFDFEDGVQWVIEKKKESVNDKVQIPIIELLQINKNGSQYKRLQLFGGNEDIQSLAMRIARRYPYLRRLDVDTWQDRRTDEIYQMEDIINKFGGNMFFHSPELRSPEIFKNHKWFENRFKKVKVSLIKAQRLLAFDDESKDRLTDTVRKYSKELSNLISIKLLEYTDLSSKLDRTYPNRLIENLKISSDISDEHLNNQLKILEEKRELLDTVGLIEIGKESNILTIENPESVIKEVLMLYIEDSFKKLENFDDISRKIKLLLQIINKRFKHKKLFIDKEVGFDFKSTTIKDETGRPKTIPVNKLSSGEQNELILFYSLLFKTNSGSLILIDEPEISLHISWQNNFINDLREISKLNSLNVLIATHSPDIISNNWDLKVELKGIE